MARTAAKANQVADAVVRELKKIGHAKDETAWLTDPRDVKRMLLVGDLTLGARPLLAVQVQSIASVPKGPQTHEATTEIAVHIICDGDPAAEHLLNDVASDVIKAISLNETLGVDDDAKPMVTSIFFKSYEPQVEVMQRVGLAITTVVFEATYEWQHTAP